MYVSSSEVIFFCLIALLLYACTAIGKYEFIIGLVFKIILYILLILFAIWRIREHIKKIKSKDTGKVKKAIHVYLLVCIIIYVILLGIIFFIL